MSLPPGPKPKPTAIRTFEGIEQRSDRRNEFEPQPEGDLKIDEYPQWLDPDFELYESPEKTAHHAKLVRYVWDKLAPTLARLGVLKDIDEVVFGRYCDTLARWMRCAAFLNKYGETYPVYSQHWETKDTGVRDENGKIVHQNVPVKVLKSMEKYPQVDMYNQLTSQLRKYEAEFGIGASTRTRIILLPKGQKAPVDPNTPPAPGGPPDDFNYAKRRLAVAK